MTILDPAQIILWGGWSGIARILFFGTAAYVALVVMLRVTGKRTLSKMNAFDLIVTVALGSTLSSVLLDSTVPLVDGLLALWLLVVLQLLVTWASVRSGTVRKLVKADPTVLARDGRYLDAAMLDERVTRDEIDAALRSEGYSDLASVDRVTLETNGKLSVVER